MKHRQSLTIAVIVVVTLALGALIVRPMLDGGHDDHAAHDDGAAHDRHAANGPAAGGPAPRATQGADPPHGRPGLVRLTDTQRAAAGIGVEAAGLTPLDATVTLPGEIRLNEDRTAHVVPRVAGVVESVQVLLGQTVRKGQVLAVIASPAVSDMRAELHAALQREALTRTTLDREQRLWNEKISAEQDYLQARAAHQEARLGVDNARLKLAAFGISPSMSGGNRFELRAPFDGVVLAKHATLGEHVGEDANVYTIADLTSVWATFNATAADLFAVKLGAPATVTATALKTTASGRVSYVGSLIGEATRTAVAHVTLANPDGAWRPGLFVNVTVVAGQRRTGLTVPDDAVQTVDGKPQVFVETADGFQARPVKTGASDGRRIEIVEGLADGERLATVNAFVLKSELEKNATDHAH